MPESKSHKATANRIAQKYETQYNEGQGADIQTSRIAIEIETPETVSDAVRQLQGYRKPVYIAGTNQEAVEKALARTEGTTIGVMDNKGNIVKKSTRRE
jgi:hypothetical protein